MQLSRPSRPETLFLIYEFEDLMSSELILEDSAVPRAPECNNTGREADGPSYQRRQVLYLQNEV